MIYFCQQKNRRASVLQSKSLNGIDYLEVCTQGDEGDCGCGKTLLLTLLHDARGVSFDPGQIEITSGAADVQVNVVSVLPGTDAAPLVVTIELNQSGDFSPYTLRLVASGQTVDPPDGFDPQLSCITFSFKAGCAAIADCAPDNCCAPDAPAPSDINYLAKDYDTFRQVMLDRLAVLTPGWQETHPSDIGMAMVEALAYAADNLSYQQDAAATEAYIGTARSRISLRRHVRLVDYQVDEGCNARAWVHLTCGLDGFTVPAYTPIYALVPGLGPMIQPSTQPASVLLSSPGPIFNTMWSITLYKEQDQIWFYTWGDASCCLVAGSTSATLLGNIKSLAVGTILIFQEQLGPETGVSEDADPTKRWPVRLTGVRTTNHNGNALIDPLTSDAITEIAWDVADALPFPLCISAMVNGVLVEKISAAVGNIVLADHGNWINGNESLAAVPAPPIPPVIQEACTCTGTVQIDDPPPRYFPRLAQSPLTFAPPSDSTTIAKAPASALTYPTGTAAIPQATPQISVTDGTGASWTYFGDLLSCVSATPGYTVEIEYDGSTFVRFGDGEFGAAAETGDIFYAHYRVGNGIAGNVGAQSLAHILLDPLQPGSPAPVDGLPVVGVSNPLPATGGRDGETMDHIRQVAPYAFNTQLRVVTEEDYGAMTTQQVPQIEQAQGTLRWTGSWYTAFVSLEAQNDNLTSALITQTEQTLNRFRMIGTDLDAEGAKIVGLKIKFEICVSDDHFRADVRAAVQRLLVTGMLCDGSPGLLNRENFTFGQTIYASPLIAAIQAVDGVESVVLKMLERMDEPWENHAADGVLQMGSLEIARCDNNPNRADFGRVILQMGGGK